MDKVWKQIKECAEKNNGIIKTSQIEELGISRTVIREYRETGDIEQIRKGLYVLTEDVVDEYALLQVQSKYAIFSYGTALFLWNMSDRTPHYFDITVPRGANISRLKKNNSNIRCHYVQPDVYELGMTEISSPQGAMVKLYDRERCICDLVREKETIELQIYIQAIKEYFRTEPNNRKLLKYAKVFGIEEKIRTYMEVL